MRTRFKDLLRGLRDESAFLSKYPHPALVMEPFGEASSQITDTPDPDECDSVSANLTCRDIVSPFAPAKDSIHPEAVAAWLCKSDRNPFPGMLTLGRAANNDIILPLGEISKLHALFHRTSDGWLVEDNGSANGTFLNEVRLPAGERQALADGARLRLGNAVVARFFEPQSLCLFCFKHRHLPGV